ncbi:MAG TPA: hypothetical protein VFL63_07960, partial [Rhodanobacteraceae bacterium]|nr:hypothetical protein [Rhodanobacteraceae bacterium]
MGGFWQRLKERKLVQWAVAYVAFAFALGQGLDMVAQQFGWPDSVRRGITLVLAAGFFVALVLAWYHGEKGRQRVGGTELLLIALVLALGGAALWRFARAPVHPVSAASATAAPAMSSAALAAALAKIPAQSVAVLPLANESGSPKQQYFSDGLSEELISDLTQIDGLKVIGKYSSFRFRDSKDSPAQIGVALGVANLIQGSVFQSAGRIRIVVNLIRAKDGASVWSHTYDKPLKDVFAIQSEIGKAVASALKVKLLGKSPVDDLKPPSGNVEAYQLMLQGRAIARHNTEADLRQGIALYRQAL